MPSSDFHWTFPLRQATALEIGHVLKREGRKGEGERGGREREKVRIRERKCFSSSTSATPQEVVKGAPLSENKHKHAHASG
tara:strand:- start:407 stop:649 length:243 start_codon:yes stop_codon:yes gene_type:complete